MQHCVEKKMDQVHLVSGTALCQPTVNSQGYIPGGLLCSLNAVFVLFSPRSSRPRTVAAGIISFGVLVSSELFKHTPSLQLNMGHYISLSLQYRKQHNPANHFLRPTVSLFYCKGLH